MNINININIEGDWSDQPLQGLTALHQAGKQIDAQIWSAVRQSKLAGHSWQEIGQAMGLSKQTVYDRYASESVRHTEQAFNDFVSNTPVGVEVDGQVASTTSFGVFVAVPPGVEGLLHVSELGDREPSSFEVGETVRVKLVKFDLNKRRLAFGAPA